MLDVFTVITIEKEELNLFGKINEANGDIELHLPMTSTKAIEFARDIIYQPKINFPVLDMTALQYSVYGCKFYRNELAFNNAGVTTIFGKFGRFVCEEQLNKKYDTISFSFQEIEKLFPLENFDTEFAGIDKEIIFTKGKHEKISKSLIGNITCTVESSFTGVYKSPNLYNLDVKQTKVVRLEFESTKTIDELLEVLYKIKKYFEFILKQEIKLTNINISNGNSTHRQGKLVYDTILIPQTFIKEIDKSFKPVDADVFFKGLNGWLREFEKCSEVINLWQKTIYNNNVLLEDLFLWKCQAFELLCSLYSGIYEKAKSFTGKNQANPNLRNYLSAVSNIYGFCKTLDKKHFKDVKDVRDKLTHNNPIKTITETQKKNAFSLIDYFLIKTICVICEMDCIPTSLCLMVSSNDNICKQNNK